MGAVDRFLEDPVEFMQNNFVTTPEAGAFNQTGGKKFFTLEKKANTFARSVERPEAKIPVYFARPASGGDPEGLMEIYWCPYEDNSMKSIMVGNEANIMLTAPMNGCSFGVGAAADDGSRYVAHINMKSQNNAWNKQDAILKGSRMGNVIVSPHMYMGEDKSPVLVTTFGVRTPKTREWNFYYQLSKTGISGGSMTRTLVGVFPV
jgi:hypothetical protein